VVAAVADFVARHGGNILDADQHVNMVEDRRLFFQRVEIAGEGFDLAADAVAAAFAPIAERFGMTVDVRTTARRVPMAILASRQAHCLADLLERWSSGELAADVRVVVANHPDHAALCAGFGVPFVHAPVPAAADGAASQEAAALEVLAATRSSSTTVRSSTRTRFASSTATTSPA
jgi:formyltetrahydrofolate deformylase